MEAPSISYHWSLMSGKLLRTLGLYDLSSGLKSEAAEVSEELLDLEDDDDEPEAAIQSLPRSRFQHTTMAWPFSPLNSKEG